MRKLIIPAAAVVVVAGAAHVGISHWIGGALVDETQALQRRLLAIEGVSVRNLSYEKRLFDGELAFDLAWRPPQGHPLREAMELSGRGELSLSGRAAVRHGPWVGGFGIARSETTLPLPEEMRAHLPKYPGQSPWLRLDGFVDWSRRLTLDFRVVDYAGAVGPAALGAEATLDGARGRATLHPGATQGALEFSIARLGAGSKEGSGELRDLRVSVSGSTTPRTTLKAELSLGALGGEVPGADRLKLQAGALRAEIDATREWQFLWTGKSSIAMREGRLEAAGGNARLPSVALRSETLRKDRRVSSTAVLEVGASEFRGTALPGFAFQMSTDGIEGEAFDEILSIATRIAERGKDDLDEATTARLGALAKQLLAAGPRIAIDRLALSVRGRDDIGLSASVGVPAGTDFALERAMQLADAIEAKATLALDLASLEELLLRGAALSASIAGREPPGQADLAAMRADFARARAEAARLPMVVVEGDRLRSELRYARGKLEANGKPLDLAEAAMSAMGSLPGLLDALPGAGDLLGRPATRPEPQRPRATAPSAPAAPAPSTAPPAAAARPAEPARQPNAGGEPTFGRVALAADFQPDPHRVEITAGGKDRVDGRLGAECVGFIEASKPDFVLDYAAGQFDLFVYATSDADTAIVLRAPDGAWHCNDDGDNRGVDPTLRLRRPQSGRYAIWVSTVEGGETDAELLISEADPDPKRPK